MSTPTATGAPLTAARAEQTPRVRVWDVPTRVFHWGFAACFAGAWLTADSERLRDLHVMLGYTFAGLLAFRLLWGLIGTRYARFANFVFAPRALVAYLRSLLALRPEHHAGHNPAGAIAIFAMLGLGIVIALSGYATWQEFGGDWLEDLHEGAASTMLAVVGIHLAGVLVSSVLHGENLAATMVSGMKRGSAGEAIPRPHRILGGLLLAAVVGFWITWASGLLESAAPASLGANLAASASDRDDDSARR